MDALIANWRTIVAVLGVLLGLVGVTIAVTDEDQNGVPDKVVVEKLPGVVPDADQQVDAGDLAEAGARPGAADPELALENVGPEIHEDARDETPPGVTQQESADAQVEAPGVGEPLPLGGAQNYRCTPNYVVNQSALSGARSGVALHFTVSSPGSINAIRGMFNTPSFGASSNYGIELDGECQQWVPDNRKAWCQGAFNSAYNCIEIVTNDLTRAQWLAAPIIRDGILASLVADLLRGIGAPPRHVDPVGCSPLAGVTDHNALECGNTHWDVGPGFPWPEFMAQVKRAYSGGSPVCGKRCQARRKQRRVIAARKERHRATHADYQREGCRGRMHEVPARELGREACQRIKRRGHRQHLGISRARKTLRGL